MNHDADTVLTQRLTHNARLENLPTPPHNDTTAHLIAAHISAHHPHRRRFTTDIARAHTGTRLALAAATTHPDRPWKHAHHAHHDDSVWFEQCLLLGHPLHPLARLRGHFSADDIIAYAPEHQARFPLGLYRLPQVTADNDWPWSDRHGPLLPLHPWQARRYGLTAVDAIDQAAPLSGLRTVSTGTHHVKCSLDAQLTSAIRHVSPTALHATRLTPRLAGVLDDFDITLQKETACYAHDATGRPLPHLAAISRQAPPARTLPLAAGCETCPTTGEPLLAKLHPHNPRQWFTRLLDRWLTPCLRLFDHTGVALEAHGQNCLTTCDDDGLPDRLVYRDLGGVAFSRHHHAPDGLTPSFPEARRRLTAAVSTTLHQYVDILGHHTTTPAPTWWTLVADHLTNLGGPTAEFLLTRPWPHKALLRMRLAHRPTHNQWVDRPNPLGHNIEP
ncbi:IucA/IucC family C-terminal-domain containing protein [Haloglycomyces albus]|uniref:IucA/IucC family C-terminal-domain containing protein n=1 Tax=Haloglycomyces albus TaxID=526067 RepID=UPI00046CDCAF|nr:IucA/IucC family C-terminal-domain containing protein [Haloglycomyces albus]